MAASLPATFVKGVVRLDDLPRAPIPEVAASGRSNVGKSTLLNTVFARKGLAKVSSTPGKTREINFFSVAGSYHLVDLPGYGYAQVPVAVSRKWGAFVRQYLETRAQLAGVIQLVDSRHGPSALDREMLEWLRHREMPALVVATKTDKLKKSQLRAELSALEKDVAGFPLVGFSSVTRDGRRPILDWIDRAVADWRKLDAPPGGN